MPHNLDIIIFIRNSFCMFIIHQLVLSFPLILMSFYHKVPYTHTHASARARAHTHNIVIFKHFQTDFSESSLSCSWAFCLSIGSSSRNPSSFLKIFIHSVDVIWRSCSVAMPLAVPFLNRGYMSLYMLELIPLRAFSVLSHSCGFEILVASPWRKAWPTLSRK